MSLPASCNSQLKINPTQGYNHLSIVKIPQSRERRATTSGTRQMTASTHAGSEVVASHLPSNLGIAASPPGTTAARAAGALVLALALGALSSQPSNWQATFRPKSMGIRLAKSTSAATDTEIFKLPGSRSRSRQSGLSTTKFGHVRTETDNSLLNAGHALFKPTYNQLNRKEKLKENVHKNMHDIMYEPLSSKRTRTARFVVLQS